MVAAERPAATALAVRVAAGVSVTFLSLVSSGRVVGVDATYQAVATASWSSRACARVVRCEEEEEEFLREGPNGFVLRVECDDSMLELRFLEGLLRNPARLETRSSRRPRPCRDGATGRYVVATLLSVALRSRQARAPRHGRGGPPRETSQQRQGARRAEETGR
ncbi:hypothetical protein Taro_025662 [Colocasia esculenta]|uniref:Uncharacterized protein n=1 Tax=Colocasia esculenta TaxID=4460 RepID=A0A843VH68_COLES|nr:hypothetical protein [Colocasia esculenta]